MPYTNHCTLYRFMSMFKFHKMTNRIQAKKTPMQPTQTPPSEQNKKISTPMFSR